MSFQVELMFKYYKERQKELNDPHKKKRDIFIEICSLLRNHGYTPTPKQCDRKMRNMKATYIRTLERIKRGDALATCQYYDELYDIYGLNPPLQTPSRVIAAQNRNRPVPVMKAEYINGQSPQETYEPSLKKMAFEGQDQRDSPMPRGEGTSEGNSMPYLGPGPREGASNMYMFDVRMQAERKAVHDLMEELKAVQNTLQQERESREEERKAFAEERREFHKERMSMLNSINKLIGSIDQKSPN